MHYLGVDVGMRRSGFAYADSQNDILFSLETFSHTSQEELAEHIAMLVSDRAIDVVVLGNPLLPSGIPGKQSRAVQALASLLESKGIRSQLLDERYSTAPNSDFDPDAASACEILGVVLQRK